MTVAAIGAGAAGAVAAAGAAGAAGAGTAAALGAAAIGAAGSIAGSALAKSSSSKTTTSPSGGSEKGTIKTSGFSPEIMKLLEDLISNGQFSKDAAIKDSRDAVTGAMQDVMQQYMPDIAASAKGTGMMGDSMTQLLANQTATQAAVQGGKVRMESISNYNTNLVNLLNSLAAGQAKTETRDLVTKNEPTTTTESGGMCWITSAICEELKLPDNCQTLQVLRWFRDNYMLDPSYPERVALVDTYYNTAFAFKTVLDTLPKLELSALYTRLNNDYLQPAVRNVIAGEYDAALSVYTHMYNAVCAIVYQQAPELAPVPAASPDYASIADLAAMPDKLSAGGV